MSVLTMLLTMIMSLFSSILIGLAPCNSNYAALDQENTIEVKLKDNLIKDFGYMAVSPVEFLSKNEFYNNFGSTFRSLQAGGFYSLPYFSSETRAVYLESLGDTSSEGTDFGYSVGFSITGARFDCLDVDVPASSSVETKFFKFTIFLTNNDSLIYQFYLTYYNLSTNNSLINACVVSSGVYNENEGLIPTTYHALVCTSRAWLYNAEGIVNNDYDNGLTQGYNVGFDEGYYSGIERGKEIASDPASDIYESTYNAGKQAGDAEGYQRAISQGSTAATIFSGIVTVGLLPVNVLLTMFQYEVFGINIAGLVSGFLTIAVVIIVIRFVTGKKND